MGRRVSVWEANAERRADTVRKKEAAAISLENRQRIQQKATAGRRILSLERKRLEQQRQLDQQRAEIHPSHVQETLQALVQYQQQTTAPPPPPKNTGLLSPALPEDDAGDTPIVHLTVRSLEGDHE
jgi:hypothetical protein